MGSCLRPIASGLKSASDTESLNPEGSSRLGSREFAEILDLWSRTRARPRASMAAMRSRCCLLGRSEKDRFDMAYPTGFRKNELRLSQLTRVMYAVGEKMGAEEIGRLSSGWRFVSFIRKVSAIADQCRVHRCTCRNAGLVRNSTSWTNQTLFDFSSQQQAS
jgi:hypothetical protein